MSKCGLRLECQWTGVGYIKGTPKLFTEFIRQICPSVTMADALELAIFRQRKCGICRSLSADYGSTTPRQALPKRRVNYLSQLQNALDLASLELENSDENENQRNIVRFRS